MAIGIDPLVDYACKQLLGNPEHPSITLHFINAIMRGFATVTAVDFLNPNIEKRFANDKYSIFDVRARDSEGRKYNIEIQRTRMSSLPERLIFYGATQIVEQIGEGDRYSDLRPAIGICILDSILFRDLPDLHLDFRFREAKGHRRTLTDHLQIHVLQLPRYTLPSDNREITDPIEQWCYFFREANRLTAAELRERLPYPAFSEATGVLQMIARDPKQRSLYEARLKAELDARANTDDAREEGREEGEAIGEARGKVKILRDLSGEMSPSDGELRGMTLDQLVALENDFQQRLRKRS